MKSHIKLIFLLFLIFLSSTIFSQEYNIIDRIEVSVEKAAITRKEIKKEIQKKYRSYEIETLPSSKKEEIKENIIRYLIEKKLIEQYAENIKITPSAIDIDLVINNILNANDIEINDLKNQLIADGSNLEDFKEDLKFNITVQRIKDREIMPYVNISEYEIDALIEKKEKLSSESEFKITHLLVKKNNPNKKLIINEITKLKKNEDFSELAKKYSDGPNAENYGDLGWKKINDLPEIFLNFISNKKIGVISEPIESSNGLHFIKIESIRNSEEINKVFIKQYKFQQIVLKHSEIILDDEHEKKLNLIKNFINDGLDFSEAIKKYSDEQFNIDPNKLEWLSVNNLLPEFRIKLSQYPAKKLIGPFKTELGWHLIQVYDFRESDVTSDTIREKAKIEIARNKTEIRYQDWLDALIKNSKITYFND